MLPPSYRILKFMDSYNGEGPIDKFFGWALGTGTRHDFSIYFLTEKTMLTLTETKRALLNLEENGKIRTYPRPENPDEIMVSLYGTDGRKLF